MNNPDLLNPTSQVQASVPAATRFRNVNEFGQTVENTKPLPATEAATVKSYTSSMLTTSFIRHDGKKLPFVDGFFETNLLYDQQYLDAEIADGNAYVRYATQDEIEAAHFRRDPRGTIREQVKQEVLADPEIRAALEAEIRRQIIDEGKIQGVDPKPERAIKSEDGVSLQNLGGGSANTQSGPAPLLKPVSTKDLSGLLAGSNQK